MNFVVIAFFFRIAFNFVFSLLDIITGVITLTYLRMPSAAIPEKKKSYNVPVAL